jgi:putative exporter of polyketide antibiotics
MFGPAGGGPPHGSLRFRFNKSTTIRVLLGLLRADAGLVELLAGDPWRDVVGLHRRLAYVPGDVSLWPGLTGGEAIDLLGRLRGGLDERRRSHLLERFELDPTKRGRTYSKGNRQKVAIVASVWGLALRLHRGSMIGWTLVFVVLGVVFGYLSTTLGGVFARTAEFAAVLGARGGSAADLTFAFLLTLLTVLGIIAAVYGVQIGMRFYAEELDYRTEPLLAAALTRPKLFASHAVIALLGPAAALLLGGAVIGVTSSAAGGSVGAGDLIVQALAEIPAVWVLIGLSLALIGAHPIARPAAWLGVVAAFVLTILGPMFRLWDWILGISPFWHVPNITTTDPGYLGLLWLSVIAAALIAAGFAGYRRRDVI